MYRFCGSCGAPAPALSETATVSAASDSLPTPAAGPPVVRIVSSDSMAAGGFTPGTILAGRYRVIGLLGRGGMGEVYRADDLKLGQPVALKFLPRALAVETVQRERFLAEVRIARQVAHPNVCRVYDIAELDGQQFLSMEYIDGEDLASLLKRIGRLPPDKALDIARQICEGLAAAHDRGVLHRDLKPANVMLDGRGRVRITDFGLAVAAGASGLEADVSGTPAYMAPEQLAGKGASVRSDIYGLGLVLYELYTGKRAFTASSFHELRARKDEEMPPPPSEFIKDIDPVVERVILRAIARDPRARQASAAQVAAALPGGSPLEAALRSGETPSPEMVAASGSSEGLHPPIAWALLALVILGTIAAVSLGSNALLWRRAALERSPDALVEKAREIGVRLGYAEPPVDRASGFEADLDYLRYLQTQDRSRSRWDRHDPSFLRFWYRESPQPLESWRYVFRYGNLSRVDPVDPPLDLAGMTLIRLDPGGRLVQLVVVPTSTGDAVPAENPDWPALLKAGGFDPSVWKPVEPRSTPPFYADARAAWEGTWPGRSDLKVRLEAGGFHGKPVYFEAVFPWTRPVRAGSNLLTGPIRTSLVPIFLVVAAMIAAVAIFARRNLRAGRGDRRGAFRLSAFVFATMFLAWFFGESHVATLWEVVLVTMALSWALLTSGFCWLAYVAVEPFVRRRWPEVLVSWARLLGGEFRDPLVGRELLVGCVGGIALALIGFAGILLPGWLGLAPELIPADLIGVAYGLQRAVPLLVWRLGQSVIVSLATLFLLFLVRLALGSRWRAIAACVLLSSIPGALALEHFWISLLHSAAITGVFFLLLVRVGLVASVAAFYTWGLFVLFPVTMQMSAWYAGSGVTALLVLAALALFGFTTSLGGRPALGDVELHQ
jgi:hypothetical protein